MSMQYVPDREALPDSFWAPLFVANRDMAAGVPIDFVTHPDVSVTSACFSDGTYHTSSAQKCISNLLATEFRRLIFDLYWDASNGQFNLCPIELPKSSRNTSSISASSATNRPRAGEARYASEDTLASINNILFERQDSSQTVSSRSSASSSSDRFSTSTGTATTTSDRSSSSSVAGSRKYSCSRDLSIQSIIALYNDYFSKTADTVNARLQFLVFNMYVASSENSTSNPQATTAPQTMPDADDLIGTQFTNTLTTNIYTPNDLRDNRKNLNESWLKPFRSDVKPALEYFHIRNGANGNLATDDGWPNEDWLLNSGNARVLLTWGEVSTRMETYNFRGDSGTIFQAEVLSSNQQIDINTAGQVTSGCFFESSTTELSRANSSWASSTINVNNDKVLFDTGQNVTSCGISQILNNTLERKTANDDPKPYQDFTKASIFGWAPGEPKNTTSSQSKKSEGRSNCVVIDVTSDYQGHWRVADCQSKHRAACRISGKPYQWQLTSNDVTFEAAESACKAGSSFAVPRTGLENAYLYHHALNQSRSGNIPSVDAGVWINLNSLDTADCWVSTGAQGSCPYSDDADTTQHEHVLIPTIAAIIILILSILTVLVKCNINHRKSKTRRRGEGGWDYEGVPS